MAAAGVGVPSGGGKEGRAREEQERYDHRVTGFWKYRLEHPDPLEPPLQRKRVSTSLGFETFWFSILSLVCFLVHCGRWRRMGPALSAGASRSAGAAHSLCLWGVEALHFCRASVWSSAEGALDDTVGELCM